MTKEKQHFSKEVSHPSHYNNAKTLCSDGTAMYEPIKLIEVYNLSFCMGNALKYMIRAPHKGNERLDLDKAAWYLERHIERPYTAIAVGNERSGHPDLIDVQKIPEDWGIPAKSHLGLAIIDVCTYNAESAIVSLRFHISELKI